MRLTLSSAMVLSAFALSGCGAIGALGDASRTLDVYELRTPEASPVTTRPRNIEIVVEEPIAGGALATERIMIRPSPLQAQYLPGVRWADTAPVMLQTLILRSLSESGAFASVGRRPVGTIGDYAVLGELTDFQAEAVEGGKGATIRLRLMVRLVAERDERVIASSVFLVTEQATASDNATIIAAFDRATVQLMNEIVPWILSRLGIAA